MSDASESLNSVRRFRLGVVVLCVAALLGAVSGTAAALVRLLFRGLQWVFTQDTRYLPLVAVAMPHWRRVLTPVLGAACATALLAVRAWRAKRLHRNPRGYREYVEAVRLEHGAIPFLPNVWRTLASAFSVATGASIGREGSMIQFAAATTALVNRAAHRWLKQTRTMPSPLAVACGVAAGVTAAYQAPIAGVFFAAEIVLGELTPASLVALVLASITGELVSRKILGAGPLYPIHEPLAVHGMQWLGLAAVALAFGALGPVYQRWLKMWSAGRKLPVALVWGGLAVGLISLAEPRVWGNGDVGLADALGLHWTQGALPVTLAALAAMLGWRLLATGMATGVGTVGGVFTPTMFTGAVLASVVAQAMHSSEPVLFALAGLAALVSAGTHAPLMAAFMAVELTGEWHLLPAMLAISFAAWLVARKLSPSSLYAIASQTPLAAASPKVVVRAFPMAFTWRKSMK